MARKFRKGLQKAINVYLSKLKKSSPSERWLLPSSCRYPTAPPSPSSSSSSSSFDPYAIPDCSHVSKGATLSDIDDYLHENFKSLYTSSYSSSTSVVVGPQIDISPRFINPPDEVIKASQRFFITPGPTNSLIEEAQLSGITPLTLQPLPEALGTNQTDGRVVMTVSMDPYVDFRKSMQEMVDARDMDLFRSVDWGFLEDLLVCYLELNEKSVHESILRAFKDLTKGLRC